MIEPPRRFPPPWEIEDNGACFIFRDANGQALSHVMRRSPAGVPLRDYSRARKRGASPSTSPSCRSCCGVGDPCHVIRITAATMITQVTTL